LEGKKEEKKEKGKKNKPLIVVPRSANEVIASLKDVIDTTNRNTIILIKILSERSWTAYELSLLILEYPYETKGATGEKLANHLWERLFYFKRRYPGKVFDVWKKEWFVPGTIPDPEFRQTMTLRKKSFGPIAKKGQRRLRGECSLRSLMVEILSKQGPLEQRELVFTVKKHPDYHGMHPNHLALRKAVNSALRDGSRKKRHRRLFKKCDDDSLLTKWEVISGVTSPPVRTKPQTEKLFMLMSYFGKKRGWSVADLAKLVMHPGSGYALSPSATQSSIQENIAQHLRRNKGILFERLESPFGIRWRLKRQQPIRISLGDRLKAIDLLAEGITLSHVIEALSVRHPGLDWGTLQRLYSPPRGPFSINGLEKAPEDVIELSKRKLRIAHSRLIAQMERIHRESEFAERKSDTLARCSNSRNLKLLDELVSRGIEVISESRRGWLQIGSTKTPEAIALLREKQQIIDNALNGLSDVEKLIVKMVIFDEYSLAGISAVLGKPEGEISFLLNSALEELSTNEYLQELI